jgi:hypothetical protein
MNKQLLAAAALVAGLGSGVAVADTYVNPYSRSDGTYVQGHMRSDADGDRSNNWSTRGNTNPYTGQAGTRDPYSSYGSPRAPSGLYGTDLYGNRRGR